MLYHRFEIFNLGKERKSLNCALSHITPIDYSFVENLSIHQPLSTVTINYLRLLIIVTFQIFMNLYCLVDP